MLKIGISFRGNLWAIQKKEAEKEDIVVTQMDMAIENMQRSMNS